MTQMQSNPRRIGLPVIIALVLVIVVVFVFVIVVINQLGIIPSEGTGTPITAESYRAEVDALLAIAHPEDAEVALNKYSCTACHREATQSLAPSWVGIAERAG